MAKSRRRRSGAVDSYHTARRSLPRPLIYDYIGPAVRPRKQFAIGGYGGGPPPHAKRRAAASRTNRQTSYYPSRPWSIARQWTPGPRREALHNAPHSYQAAFSAWDQPVAPLMATVLGDRPRVRKPERVPECVRRSERKEVLFARGVAGRRGGSPGKRGRYNRSIMSNFTCGG